MEFVDIHSHVLPGIDDGCSDIEQSIFILKCKEAIGVTHLFCTPHYCRRREYTASPEEIHSSFDKLCQRVKDEKINITLHLGTEMEFSQDGIRYIKEGRVLTMGNSKYILVEFPPYVKAEMILQAVKEITAIGYIPIVAHIERYKSVLKHFDYIYKIKRMGALIQVNIRSMFILKLTMRKFLKRIISERLIDFIAADVHEYPLEDKEIKKCKKYIIKYADKKYLKKIMSANAKKFLLK